VKKMKRAMSLVPVLAFLILFAVAPVYATKPTQIEGKWIATSGLTFIGPEKSVGANHFDVTTNTGKYVLGPISGTFVQTINWVWHFGDPSVMPLPENPNLWPPGEFSWKIDRTFLTCSVAGKTGTLTMHLEAKGTIDPSHSLFTLEGTWVIISGTEGLADLHGQGTWWNLAGGGLGYEGQIHFDPKA
jgi:hypothetical protein